MNATQTPALEDRTTLSGAPMFGEETRDYLRRVRLADPATLAPWRTDTCCECEEIIVAPARPDGTSPTADGLALSGDGEFAHVILHGQVVLGCEGYWLVSPAALGLPLGHWDDWRDAWAVAGIEFLTAAGLALDPGAVAAAAICFHQKISPPARPLTFLHRTPAFLDEDSPDVTLRWTTYDLPLASWAADLTEEQAAALAPGGDAPENCIGYEALCRRCGEVFAPDLHYPDGSGMEHYQRDDQRTECGGRGDLLGGWR